MNTFTKIIATATLTLSAISMASASAVFLPADDYVTSKLCVVATEGNKSKLNRALKNSGLSKRYLVMNVKCNNQDLLSFIEQNGINAEEMSDFLSAGIHKVDKAITVASVQELNR